MQGFRSIGIASVVLAAMLWGTTGTVQTLLPEGRDPLAVGALRLIFGAAGLVLMALIQSASRRGLLRLPLRGVFFAGVAIGGYNLFFFYAVTLAGVGIGTAVAIGSAPIWATLWERFALGRRPGPLRLLGQAVSVLGVGTLGYAGGGVEGALLGVVLALMAGGCYAAYSLATSSLSGQAPSTAIAAATFTVAAVVTAPVLFFVPLDWLAGSAAWSGLIFLGLGATALSYALYTWGLMRVAASTAVTLALAEPVTAWLLASLVVAEPVTLQSVAGALMILAGLVVVTLVRDQPRGG
ncbi:DMT family transporter [Phaeobacter sp. QD34_3]|uniref:DMT family transporter n=1 Tax=unclassified Phaeobacter TaxID=2621772 RepID=UPI00237F3192|nr:MULTISPECIES: DMT family transporter [unclassified Phaeobacter]MDE4133739.1 DMT family transporter [Phaeobacter sp. QD34_3]MDE4137328.1 DMT family transporter [Phaeobacter sp. QD34_24]